MVSQSDHPYALENSQTRELTRRLLLDDQQRRIDARNALENSYRDPICPYYSISGHADCWYCRQSGVLQPLTSTDNLLRDLIGRQSQATTTSGNTDTPRLASSVSTEDINIRHSQPVTPRSTISATSLAQDGLRRLESARKLIASKPRAPDPIPVKAAAAAGPPSAPTQSKLFSPPPWRDLRPEAGFVYVNIPLTFFRFMSLPVEIRKRIYAYTVYNGSHGLLISRDIRAYHQAPITRVNRQIRSESLQLVYTENAFDAKNRELIKSGPAFARHIGDHRLGLVRDWAWFTAKRHLYIHILKDGQREITYQGPHGNEEINAIAFERATEVYNLLKKDGSFFGFTANQLTKITEIVLRITPKAKPKAEEKDKATK